MGKIVVLSILLLGVIAAGWSALWFYAAHEAGVRFDSWLATEDEQGRSWTCPDRKIGGYPLALTIACKRPTYTGHTPNGPETGSAAGAVVEAAVTHPRSLAVTLEGPLLYKSADGLADISATWSHMGIDLDGLPDIKAVALHGTDVTVENLAGETHQGGKAPIFEANFDLTRSDDTIGFEIAAKRVPMPQLDSLLGGQTPIDIDLAGTFDRKDVSGSSTLPDIIERWREQGGQVALASSRIGRGEAHVSGTGRIGLDDGHRLQGRVDASFVGLEPALKRFGINANLASAGALIGTIFGGGPPKAPAEPGALSLPISFRNGRLGVGPITTEVALPPLY